MSSDRAQSAAAHETRSSPLYQHSSSHTAIL